MDPDSQSDGDRKPLQVNGTERVNAPIVYPQRNIDVSRALNGLLGRIFAMRPTDKKPTPGLASRLRSVRSEKQLTQEKLAQLIGVSKGAVSQWELGDVTRLGYERVFRLADVLSVEPRWLALGEGEKSQGVRVDPKDLDEARRVLKDALTLADLLKGQSDARRETITDAASQIHQKLLRIEDLLKPATPASARK